MRLVRLVLWLLPCALIAQGAAVPRDPVERTTLKNGMKILVEEDHTIPTVALYFFFRVGSRNERPGITGLSHFFEHMMFNGSRKYGPGEFDREMEKNGGSNNAYTTKDTTVYTDWFPPSALDLMMDMEADRMANLTLDPKAVESERGVVYSERRLRVDNDNQGALFEQVNAAAFTAHPYHWPVIGWPSDIESWTQKDLADYYKEGYAPNNCLMVAVGDVSAANVFALARKYFESIPPHETFAEPATIEPTQRGEREVHLKKESELPLLMLAFHMPTSRSAENPAIELIEAILATGESSRLQSRLVDKEQVALNIEAFDEPSLDPYLLFISIQPRAGVTIDRLQSLALAELARLSTMPVSGPELRKAKNQWLAAHYRRMKTVSGRANLLGTYEVFHGDYRKLFSEPEDIEKVTPADIQRVAKDLFREENRTTGILDAQPAAPQATR
jgi:zinc protease